MFMSNYRLSTALVAAMSFASSAQASLGRIIMPTMPRSFQGEIDLAPMTYGHRGAGITMAQQKRASRKAKNVKRHRAASRG